MFSFEWFVPEVAHPGGPLPNGMVGKWCKWWKQVFGEAKGSFLVPALYQRATSLIAAEGFLRTPMSSSTLNRCFALLCTQLRPPDLPRHQGRLLTTYSLRRCAPTLATYYGLMIHERLPLGCWKAHTIQAEEAKAAAQARMPLLYTDEASKLEQQRAVKAMVWVPIDKLR